MIPIIVDTAVVVPVNIVPLTDDSDFKSRETTVAYNAAGMDLVWNFVTPAGAVTQTAVTPTTSGSYDWAHAGDGMYTIEIPASGGASINNDTEGVGYFTGVATGVLPWRGPNIIFGSANAINSMFGLDRYEVDTKEIGSSTQSATDLKDFADTGYDPSAHKVQGVVLVDTTTTNTDMRGTDSAATAAELAKVPKSDGTTTWNATAQGTIEAMANAGITSYDPPTRTEATSDKDAILSKLLKYFQLSLRKDAAIAFDNSTELDAINANGGTGSGTYVNLTDSHQAIYDNIGTAGAGLTDLGGMSTTMKGQVNTEADTALTDYGAAQPGDEMTLTSAYDAAKTAAQPGADGDTLKTLSDQLDTIVGDTNELQTDWANGGRLDLILDARASQTSVDDIPTNSELATALGTADDAVLAAIAALNNLSSANVSSAVTTALTTALTEGYRATGATGSVRDFLYEIVAHLGNASIATTTKTTKKIDGSTTAKTYTLNDATTPTSITEAS